jgi:hypothetical protein
MDWDAARGDWARTATRGQLRIVQGERTHLAFLNALDRIDGRKVLADFIAGLEAGLSQEEASRPRPFGPDGELLPAGAAPELSPEPLLLDPEPEEVEVDDEDDGFQACPEREAAVDWKPGERKIWDWNGVLSQRDLRALSRLNLPLERQTLVSNPRPAGDFQDGNARICAVGGEVCMSITLGVYGDALGIFDVGFTHPEGMCSGGASGSCMPAGQLCEAVRMILQDRQAPPELLPVDAPAPRWVQQSLFDLMEAM